MKRTYLCVFHKIPQILLISEPNIRESESIIEYVFENWISNLTNIEIL